MSSPEFPPRFAESPLAKLIAVEAKLFLREPAAVLRGLVFPALLLGLLGAFFPGFRDPLEDADGVRLIDLYAPIVLGLCLATLAFATLPAILATYRQFGVLRRLATSMPNCSHRPARRGSWTNGNEWRARSTTPSPRD